MNQRVARKMLDKLGLDCDCANDGQEALAALDKQAYDLVLMDCQMPVLDGWATTQEIRQREIGTSRRQIVIAMTANAMQSDREKCLQAGMDDFISKPVRLEDLDSLLRRWLTSAPAH